MLIGNGLALTAVGKVTTSAQPTLGLQFAGASSLDPRVTFTRASSATYVDSAGVLQTATTNTPRFTHDPVTLAPLGLMVEESSVNLHLHSEDATQWGTPTNFTIVPNAGVFVDGNTTFDRMVETVINSTHFYSAGSVSISYTSGTAYTRSCFLKSNGRKLVTVYLPASNFVSDRRTAVFNLDTGTVHAVETNVTATIVPWKNGIYRCSVTATASTTGVGHAGGSAGLADDGNATYLGDGIAGFFIGGAQLELGASATSVIPTTTAAATRAAEDDPFTTTLSTAGTIIIEHDAPSGRVLLGNGATAVLTSTGAGKTAIAFNGVSSSICTNGGSITTGGAVSIGPTLRLLRNNTAWANANCKRYAEYSTKLTDAQIQALTA